MSRFLNDRTRASDPGRVTLSLSRLSEIEPLLMSATTFQCGPLCPIRHPAAEMRERFAEYLESGDSRAAVVVSTDPFVVGAYSEDLDACVLLRFPTELARQKALAIGARLLTVNTFADVIDVDQERLYAVDVVPGPDRSNWSNFTPLIADFLSDDLERIEERKREISEDEWQRAQQRAQSRIARFGIESARDGRPTLAGTPVRIDGLPYFVTIDRKRSPVEGRLPVPTSSARAQQAIVFVLVVAFVIYYAFLRR